MADDGHRTLPGWRPIGARRRRHGFGRVDALAAEMVDVVIPRQHRAMLTIACDARWDFVEKIPKLLEPMHFRARSQEQRRHRASEAADYVSELTWRQPEQACPPVDVLRLIDQEYAVNHSNLYQTAYGLTLGDFGGL